MNALGLRIPLMGRPWATKSLVPAHSAMQSFYKKLATSFCDKWGMTVGIKSKLAAVAAATALMFSSAASAATSSPVNARAGEYRAAATSDGKADELFRGRRRAGGGLLFLLAGISAILITIYIVIDKDNNASPGASN